MYQEMVMTVPSYGNDTAVTRAWDAVQQHVSFSNDSTALTTSSTDPPWMGGLLSENFCQSRCERSGPEVNVNLHFSSSVAAC